MFDVDTSKSLASIFEYKMGIFIIIGTRRRVRFAQKSVVTLHGLFFNPPFCL